MRRFRPSLLLLALLAAPLAGREAAAQTPTVVIVVRHAERVSSDPSDRDPALSPQGETRAHDLADALESAGVDAIVTTQFRRTQLTAKPLADALGITPVVVAAGGAGNHPAAVAEAVRRHAGRTVLVVGHSNTVPAIVAALGGPRMTDLCESQYSEMFVLVLKEGEEKPEVIRSRFGAADPGPPAAGCPGAVRQ